MLRMGERQLKAPIGATFHFIRHLFIFAFVFTAGLDISITDMYNISYTYHITLSFIFEFISNRFGSQYLLITTAYIRAHIRILSFYELKCYCVFLSCVWFCYVCLRFDFMFFFLNPRSI